MPRAIALRGRLLAGGLLPAVCAPLIARTVEGLRAEAAAVAALGPDLLEWRVDFFDGIADAQQVLAAAQVVRAAAGGLPLLFTRRSPREGGEPSGLGEEIVLALTLQVCRSGLVEAIDFEMASDPAFTAQVRECTQAFDVALVLSCHHFRSTPTDDAMAEVFAKAARLGADVAKLAVMPQSPSDVLRLLAATLRASETLDIPVISMAMGPLGVPTRLCGGAFGSALTFARGAGVSAPGQIPIDDVRTVLGVLQRAR